jgi:hypothetical protein
VAQVPSLVPQAVIHSRRSYRMLVVPACSVATQVLHDWLVAYYLLQARLRKPYSILDPRQREKFMDKSKEFFKGKKEDPPALGEAPGSGADTIAAKRQARQRALQAAARRKGLGLSGTVATTPLGLQGDGAAVSQRRLIGE